MFSFAFLPQALEQKKQRNRNNNRPALALTSKHPKMRYKVRYSVYKDRPINKTLVPGGVFWLLFQEQKGSKSPALPPPE